MQSSCEQTMSHSKGWPQSLQQPLALRPQNEARSDVWSLGTVSDGGCALCLSVMLMHVCPQALAGPWTCSSPASSQRWRPSTWRPPRPGCPAVRPRCPGRCTSSQPPCPQCWPGRPLNGERCSFSSSSPSPCPVVRQCGSVPGACVNVSLPCSALEACNASRSRTCLRVLMHAQQVVD